MKTKYIKQVLNVLCGLWVSFSIQAQNAQWESPSNLANNTKIKGLYQIEVDDDSGQYIIEQEKGTLDISTLDEKDKGSYFWIVENIDTKTFQLYSNKQAGKLISINTDGTADVIEDQKLKSTELVFRTSQLGSKHTDRDSDIVAIGYITTQSLKRHGVEDCLCNRLSFGNNRYRVRDTGIRAKESSLPIPKDNLLEISGLTLYPNPMGDKVNYNLVSEKSGKVKIIIFDITGKALINNIGMLNGKDTLEGNIDTSSLRSGLYIMNIELPDGEKLTKKLIKE